MQQQFKPTIVTISKEDDRSIQISMPWGASLEEWKTTFKTILIFETFVEEQLKELFGEHDEEY